MTIGDTIRMFRTYNGLTQAELAAAAGVSDVTISKVEGNKVIPSTKHLKAIGKALGTPVALMLLFTLGTEKIPAEKWNDYIFLINSLRSFFTQNDDTTDTTVATI